MTEAEYDAMLFCAASAAVESLPELVCQLINLAGYQIPMDNQLDTAISKALCRRKSFDILTVV